MVIHPIRLSATGKAMPVGVVLARQRDTWMPRALQPGSVTVVQAHSEDFVGGCGGFVRHLVGLGSAVRLITLFPSGRDPQELRMREAEIAATAATLGIQADPPIGPPTERGAVVRILDGFLRRDRPELVLSPSAAPEMERHAEHLLAGDLTLAALAGTGRTAAHWRYGNVTCAPEPWLARADRAFVLLPDDLARRGELYRLHASQLARRPNARWAALPGDETAADYVELSERRSRFQLGGLRGAAGLEAAAGVELFQSGEHGAA
ncbi:MAG TPA: hypothetical protein VEU07_04745 [Candidatus Acidoferrum sp.]|nr:hypothetical protein [Candidatus Acidoferrum sp.]